MFGTDLSRSHFHCQGSHTVFPGKTRTSTQVWLPLPPLTPLPPAKQRVVLAQLSDPTGTARLVLGRALEAFPPLSLWD